MIQVGSYSSRFTDIIKKANAEVAEIPPLKEEDRAVKETITQSGEALVGKSKKIGASIRGSQEEMYGEINAEVYVRIPDGVEVKNRDSLARFVVAALKEDGFINVRAWHEPDNNLLTVSASRLINRPSESTE